MPIPTDYVTAPEGSGALRPPERSVARSHPERSVATERSETLRGAPAHKISFSFVFLSHRWAVTLETF